MPLALIMSSHVAGSSVGGSAQALALAAFGVDAVEVPTVLFGRHPGWGAPGGGPVPLETFEGMLEGVDDNGLLELSDLVLTGYFASPEQVAIAAEAARACPNAVILVDPIMGDAGKGLYVAAEVAEAIERELLPMAHLIAPNAWEAEKLTGITIDGPPAAVEAARYLGKPTLISSVACGEEIGVVYADPRGAWLAAHRRLPQAPNGAGDLLTALFAANLLDDISPADRLARTVGGVALAVEAANEWQAPELPIVALGARLKDEPSPVRIEQIA
jgi:pyridoxine kinase